MGHVHKDKMPLQLKSFMLGHRFSDTPPAIIDSTSFIRSVIRKQPDRMFGSVMVLFLKCL